MRRLAFALLIGALANSAITALRTQDQPTFRTGTTLIEFSIVALDDKGNPVTDLIKDEIVVSERGQSREVAFFRFEGSLEPRASNALPPGQFTNRFDAAPNTARHITAIVVDAINTQPVAVGMQFTQASIRDQIVRYLDVLPPHTRVAVYRLGRDVKVLHEFTDDVPSLRAQVANMDLALQEELTTAGFRVPDFGWSGSGGGSAEGRAAKAEAAAAEAKAVALQNAAIQDMRLDLTLAGLGALGNHLAGFPGRKNVVWVGGGLPFNIKGMGWKTRYEPLMRKTAERLATQGVAIYPVASQLKASAYVPGALELFADVTGGRVTFTLNEATEGLKTTAVDQRGIYSVGFYAVGTPDNRWHPVDVRVKRPGVKVTYRQGYISEAPAALPLELSEDQWRVALANPLGSSAVRLDGQFQPAAGGEPGAFDLRLQIALADLHFRDAGGKAIAEVEIVTAEKIAVGDFAFRVERASLGLPANAGPASVARYSRRLSLKPGTSTLRLIVRDRFTGRYGTVDIPLN